MDGRVLFKRGRAHLAGGHIGEGAATRVPPKVHSAEIVGLALGEHGALDDGAGGYDADHVPLDQALDQTRILQLLAHGHLVALLDQPRDILLRGVVGHAAHGGLLFLGLAPVAGGQRQLQLFGTHHGVLVEHLIEVAETEKQQTVRVLGLDSVVLGFHRGGFRRQWCILPFICF